MALGFTGLGWFGKEVAQGEERTGLRLAHRLRALSQRCGDLGRGESRQAELDHLDLVGRKLVQQQAELVAAFGVFLCREEAQNINGANYSIDGGWTAE